MDTIEEDLFLKKEKLLKKHKCDTIEELIHKLEMVILAQKMLLESRDTKLSS